MWMWVMIKKSSTGWGERECMRREDGAEGGLGKYNIERKQSEPINLKRTNHPIYIYIYPLPHLYNTSTYNTTHTYIYILIGNGNGIGKTDKHK